MTRMESCPATEPGRVAGEDTSFRHSGAEARRVLRLFQGSEDPCSLRILLSATAALGQRAGSGHPSFD
jgi:hypothetical protein